jgi:hypothetical protein
MLIFLFLTLLAFLVAILIGYRHAVSFDPRAHLIAARAQAEIGLDGGMHGDVTVFLSHNKKALKLLEMAGYHKPMSTDYVQAHICLKKAISMGLHDQLETAMRETNQALQHIDGMFRGSVDK